jgi:hypothetical protein
MSTKLGTVTPDEARELKRRAAELDEQGGGVPHAEVRARWLAKLGRELREMVRSYDGGQEGAKEIFRAYLIAQEEGVEGLAEIRHELLVKIGKGQAA